MSEFRGVHGPKQTVRLMDGPWHFQPVPGAKATKDYVCPKCSRPIFAGTPHMVAWPGYEGGVAERRHWHTTCWRRFVNRKQITNNK